MPELMDHFKSQQQNMIDFLTTLVNYETPSLDKDRVDALGTYLTEQFQASGADSVERIPMEDVGDCLLAKWNADAPGKPILIMVHMDTVWPVGTLERRPVSIDDKGRLYGPGAVDMKGGITTSLHAIRALRELDQFPQRPIWYLATSDEEIGSRYSRPIIEETARECDLVLVMEPGTSDGSIKTQRKGVATYRVTVQGKSSHAGNEPEAGINAIVELAQQITELNRLNDLRNGTSVSVTTVSGGTATNVIPDKASIFVDTRTLTALEANRINKAMSELTPHVPGALVEVEVTGKRPPMEYNATMRATLEQAQQIGKAHGVTVRGESVGGGSDGNLTAAMGIPTLDGLGCYGGGLHAEHEHVVINSLIERATVIAGILRDWA